jgi:outer membrane protein assembly factor BamB
VPLPPLWRFGAPAGAGNGILSCAALSPPRGAAGAADLFFGGPDGSVFSLAASSGALRWRFAGAPGSYIVSSPTLGADGRLVIGTSDGRLLALNASDGALAWSYSVGAPIFSAPALGADRSVVFAAEDGGVYALRAGCPPSRSRTPTPITP